jgi:hypothetical protein
MEELNAIRLPLLQQLQVTLLGELLYMTITAFQIA